MRKKVSYGKRKEIKAYGSSLGIIEYMTSMLMNGLISRGIHRALDKNGSTGSSLGVSAQKLYDIIFAEKLTHHEEHRLYDKKHRGLR